MSMYFLIRRIKVEGANAISGLTYGFPAMTHFLGFTHALSRKLHAAHGLSFSGCGVICHDYQVLGHRGKKGRDLTFSLSRNPLKKNGDSPSFVEEGKLHMEVSLLIRCDFQQSDIDLGYESSDEDIAQLQAFIAGHLVQQKLAGGLITGYQKAEFVFSDGEQQSHRRILRSLLPGFALMDRTHLLTAHHAIRSSQNPETELIDSWLEFFTLRYHAASTNYEDPVQVPVKSEAAAEQEKKADSKVQWQRTDKPAPGWLVPTMSGYQAISPLFENKDVAHTRDGQTPFRLAEAVYSVGEWLSPHRLSDPSQLVWEYHQNQDDYLAVQKNNAVSTSLQES